MEAPSLSYIVFFLSLFPLQSLSQQPYVGNDTTCSMNVTSGFREYVCVDSVLSCDSYLIFRSRPPFDTPHKIAHLFDSFPDTDYALDEKIPIHSSVTVPVSCLCWGNSFKYRAEYAIARGDSYQKIANDIFQGLTVSCSALRRQNNNDAIDRIYSSGRELQVPLRCACPTQTQKNNGVVKLLVYMVQLNDTISSIATDFGVDVKSVLQANELSNSSSLIYPFTPILVPLKFDTCRVKPSSCRDESRRKYWLKLSIATGVGSGIAFLILVLAGCRANRLLKKRKQKLKKEKFFKRNGGLLLQEKLNKNGENVKIFGKEELERATDNYNQSRFLGQGGYGTVYKGMLQDGTIVAIKRAKHMETNWIEQFINEVAILSQINHRNVVKLLGCCLETEYPLLVYEFVSNGTLSQHIYKDDLSESPSLSWETRLRIASEVAGAISYMHSAASIPIFHRDIKSSNILLDDNYNVKVSDFGTSRFVPGDQTHLTTKVQGTFGYIDPEYFRSSQFTEKSDVYSFGVLMIELLTGKQPFTFGEDEGRNLIHYFISLEKDHQLVKILDTTVAKEAKIEAFHHAAKLAIRCLRLNGKRRPTMKQVFLELEGLRKPQDCLENAEQGESIRIPSMHSSSSSYEEFMDECSISIEIENL